MAGETILVVDDHPANLQLAEFLLKTRGYVVTTAGNAEEAIAKARSLLPRLILMDVQMPGMDGLAATRKIKEDNVTAHIPVVALTAYAMQGDKEKCLEAGCAGYITKPIDTREFAGRVSSYLAGAN